MTNIPLSIDRRREIGLALIQVMSEQLDGVQRDDAIWIIGNSCVAMIFGNISDPEYAQRACSALVGEIDTACALFTNTRKEQGG